MIWYTPVKNAANSSTPYMFDALKSTPANVRR